MNGKRCVCLYHVGLKNVGCQDDFFAFFIFDIPVSSSLGDFIVSHSMASSQDSGNIKMTTRKAKGCAATLPMQVFSINLCYLQKLSGRDKKGRT